MKIFPKPIKALLLLCSLTLALSACSTTQTNQGKKWPLQQRVKAQVELGMGYLQRGDLSIAKDRFNKALSINPKSSEAHHGLGLIEIKSLNYSKARQYLAQAVKLDNENANAVSDYALTLCQAHSSKEGLKILSEYRQKVSGIQQLNMNLAWGRCYQANQQPLRAEHTLQVILSTNPTLLQALLPMAQLKYSSQQYLLARGFLQRYFATNTISPQALLLSAKVEDKLNNHQKRDKYTTQLWSRYPKSKHSLEARELFGYHP